MLLACPRLQLQPSISYVCSFFVYLLNISFYSLPLLYPIFTLSTELISCYLLVLPFLLSHTFLMYLLILPSYSPLSSLAFLSFSSYLILFSSSRAGTRTWPPKESLKTSMRSWRKWLSKPLKLSLIQFWQSGNVSYVFVAVHTVAADYYEVSALPNKSNVPFCSSFLPPFIAYILIIQFNHIPKLHWYFIHVNFLSPSCILILNAVRKQ
jgi:hypothetical protein